MNLHTGMRLTPKSTGATNPYNSTDMQLAKTLLPGLNFVRLVLDFYSNGTCESDIYCPTAVNTGYI